MKSHSSAILGAVLVLLGAAYLSIPYISGAGELLVFCGALTGAGLGFLWFNAYPAQVFMGDIGALAIGAALGAVAVIVRQELVLLVMGGVGLAVLIFVFGEKPGSIPGEVLLIILTVIMAASAMEAAGGIDWLVRIAQQRDAIRGEFFEFAFDAVDHGRGQRSEVRGQHSLVGKPRLVPLGHDVASRPLNHPKNYNTIARICKKVLKIPRN